jgi:hypothetical protein
VHDGASQIFATSASLPTHRDVGNLDVMMRKIREFVCYNEHLASALPAELIKSIVQLVNSLWLSVFDRQEEKHTRLSVL